jgi:hypothetical protein
METSKKPMSLYQLKCLAEVDGLQLTPEHCQEILARLIRAESDLAALAVNGKKCCELLGIIDGRGKPTNKSGADIGMQALGKLANPFGRQKFLDQFTFLGDLLPLVERYAHLADEYLDDPQIEA